MALLVKVDKRHYRTIAQEFWGLSDLQMEGKHVHHRIPRSQGGTNDCTNLYVCSPEYHANVWHEGEVFKELVGWASLAGKKSAERLHAEKDEQGRSIHGVKSAERLHAEVDEQGRSLHTLRLHAEKDEQGRSINSVKGANALHAKRDGNGKSIQGIKNAKRLNAQKWKCTLTGKISTAGALSHYQKKRGIDTNNRIRLN